MAGYEWFVGTLIDGRITGQIPALNTSWSDVMDDAGPLSVDLPLADPDVAALRPYVTAEPCRCFLAVAYLDDQGTETFLAGGPIWTHNYDGASKDLTIGASGVWSYYDHRKILPVLMAGVNPATVTTAYTSSLGTIAKKLVQLAHTHTGGALPIVFPADETGTNVRTYPGYEMDDVGQALRDLTGVDGGPEIQFVPRRRADDGRYLEWVMRIGTTEKPLLTQTGADHVWDASVPQSSVSSISASRDGSAMASRAWMQGSGTDTQTLFAQANSTELLDDGFPLLEAEGSGEETVTIQSTLDAAAKGLLAQSARPLETWAITVRRDDSPNVAQYSVGDYVSFIIADDPYLPDGTFRTRLTGRAGDDSQDVTLTLAPVFGGI